MKSLIEKYISNISKEQVASFALMHNIILRKDELDFTYSFIKNHYNEILDDNFNIDKYKNYYTTDNFNKIKALFTEYSNKYSHFFH